MIDAAHSAARYRGRLAPSPTGYLHVGHALTFHTAWARAREARGTLVMRMEDLDPERSRKVYADAALEDLRWLGLDWEEGPDIDGPDIDGPSVGGPFGPYAQSQRGEFYLAAWHRLLAAGFIYPCRCSRKDLASALSAPHEGAEPDDEPVYPGTCRPASLHGPATDAILIGAAQPGPVNWRFRVPDGKAVDFTDLNLGPQRFVAGVDFGDFLVWRGGGQPSYQLACVTDDAAMQITEVVRGADLLKSAARQILLNRALGYACPAWFHCRLVTDSNGKRLAKRHDALSIRRLRERGLAPSEILRSEFSIDA